MTTQSVSAAGGIVWGPRPDDSRIAVIHRPRHGGDWSLPKGKLDPGETWEEAALREVKEEIGCHARLGDFAGEVTYALTGGATKVVRFWHMFPIGEIAFTPSAEVDRLEWLTVLEAIQRLTYSMERDLLIKLVG